MPEVNTGSGCGLITLRYPAACTRWPMYMSSTICPRAHPTPPTAASASRRKTMSWPMMNGSSRRGPAAVHHVEHERVEHVAGGALRLVHDHGREGGARPGGAEQGLDRHPEHVAIGAGVRIAEGNQ